MRDDIGSIRRSVEHVLEADKDVIETAAYRAPELKIIFDELDRQKQEFKNLLRRVDDRYRKALQAGKYYPDQLDEEMLDQIQEYLR